MNVRFVLYHIIINIFYIFLLGGAHASVLITYIYLSYIKIVVMGQPAIANCVRFLLNILDSGTELNHLFSSLVNFSSTVFFCHHFFIHCSIPLRVAD